MKKITMGILIAMTAMSIGLSTAQAKRMGNGGSVGKQSQNVSPSGTHSSQAPMANKAATPAAVPARPAAPPAAPVKPASAWKGMLGGALLGLGLGALFSHLGLGAGLASMLSTMLMIGLLVAAGVFIYRMFIRKSDSNTVGPAFGTASSKASYTPEIGSRIEPNLPMHLQSSQPAAGSFAGSNVPFGVPADFDVPAFLRHAKTYYIRLQAAWDKADINDIREFTTSEMFAELSMEIRERGTAVNRTDVVTLDAELLGIEDNGIDYLASVKFSGMIREADNVPAEAFAEVWNLSKPVAGQGGWILAGIQQV